MPIQIRNLRLTHIWAEAVLDLVSQPQPNTPMAFLGRQFTYEPKFKQILQTVGGLGGLQVPWEPSKGPQYFWSRYLHSNVPGPTELAAEASKAWALLVPLRRKLPAPAASWLARPLLVEAFYYPHGLALAITAQLVGQFSLDDAVAEAFEVRKTGRFVAEFVAGQSQEVSLEGFAHQLLADLRRDAFGAAALPDASSLTPFSVVTVLRAEGVTTSLAPANGGEVHRALEAMTVWQQVGPGYPLPDLASVTLDSKKKWTSDVLYARDRGRTVWFPRKLGSQAKRIHSLSCYHRNLTFASLQVESLGLLTSHTAALIQQGQQLPLAHEECARNAGVVLGRFYTGAKKKTYRSMSLRSQIEQDGWLAPMNALRQQYGLQPVP